MGKIAAKTVKPPGKKPAARGPGPETAKNPASKKTGPKKAGTKTPAENFRHTVLTKELLTLIPQLNEEGLAFLLEQAQIHLYNMQVDEHNRAILQNQDQRSSAGAKGSTKARQGSKTPASDLQIVAEKSSYYIVYRGKWIMFTKDEMARLAKIVSAPVSKYDRNEALFRWIERERRDIFGAIPIRGKTDPLIDQFALEFVKYFKL
ncbi:MAG: hypothetical protein LBE02_02175 [Spirochaetaceae bacterium]|jgi:hypothetical protein|nr:hypothetical protein [Spirochaetaceae bacterium]